MTDVPSNESESLNAENKPVTVGMRLRDERLSRGIKISEIATQLHITNHYVKSIETNKFDKLPGAIFVKGYLKNYSELLGLNSTEIIGLYEKFVSQENENRPDKITPKKQQIKNRLIVGFSVALFILLFAALWAYSSFFYGDMAEAPDDLTALGSAPTLHAEVLDPSKTLSSISSSSPSPKENLDVEIIQIDNAELYSDTFYNVVNMSSEGTDVLDVEFLGDSWIEVMDVSKKTKYRNIMIAGDILRVNGHAPFYVLVAEALVARIVFNGVEIDLVDEIRIDKSASVILGI